MAVALLATLSTSARAQADEIQVYDASIAPRGVFNLTWHNNYIANGVRGQAFPVPSRRIARSTAYRNGRTGATPWFEAGLYLPLYSHDETVGWGFNGFKLRALFVVPTCRRSHIRLRPQLRNELQRQTVGYAEDHGGDATDYRVALEADRHHDQPDSRYAI